jgi:glycerophosphoryl diester phosphodiesterase
MCNAGLVKSKMSKTWLAVAVAVCLFNAPGSSAMGDEEDSGSPFKDTFIISAHRAGGRVHAPDNSMPNILYAIQNQFTAVEVDLRLTRDGDLVLWHDASLPKEYVEPGAAGNIAVSSLSSDQVSDIRYSAMVRDRMWDDVKVVFADELVRATKGKINLHVHPKDVPAKTIIEFIRGHKIQKECMVMNNNIDYLKAIASAEPDVCLEFCSNTLGRRQIDGVWQWYPTEKQHELYHQLMKELETAGIDAFCTKGLTKQKVSICHEYGIMVRTSAAHMQPGHQPDRYLRMGVDYALTDDPILMKESVRRLRPVWALSKPGQTFLELVRGNK